MSIAEEPAESSSDELTQIGYDEKTTLLSGKPLVEAMLEIKERGASHQNIADGIDEMAKGDKPRFGGFPQPLHSPLGAYRMHMTSKPGTELRGVVPAERYLRSV